jgi:uncharacterized membrane protein YccC
VPSIGAVAAARRAGSLRARLDRLLPLDRRAFSLAAGIRAATACAIPVLIAELTDRHALSWIAIVAFWGCQADPGGAWRARFMAMASFTLLATLGCLLALTAEPMLWLAVPFIFVWSFGGSLARIFGNAATTVGVLITVDVVVCLGTPAANFTETLERAGMTLAGGVWAMLLVLVIWRLYPYGPARRAVGDCWRMLGHYARTLGELQAGKPDEAAWAVAMRDRRGATRSAIEAARGVLTHERRRHAGESGRGELLLVLLADADQIFEALIALSELLELPRTAASPRVQRALRAALHRFGRQAVSLGQGLVQKPWASRGHPRRSLALVKRRMAELKTVEGALPEAVELLERVTHYLQIATDMAAGIRPPRTLSEVLEDGARGPLVDWAAMRALLRGNLGFESLSFRHALRVAVTAAIGESIILTFDIERGYWLSLTAIVILQPFMAATWRRSIERVVGSVLGGLIAAGIGGIIHSPLAIAALIFPLSVITIAVRSVNYTLFVLCLTPQFVLIAELFRTGQVGDWSLAGLRALDSTVGGVLGLIAGFVLWPSWEEPHLKKRLAEALIANRNYLAAVFAKAEADDENAVQAARRAAGLASANAEASLQRVLAEPRRTAPHLIEAGMTMVTCLRRLAGVAAALSLLPEKIRPDAREEWATRSVGWTVASLDAIAAALRNETPPPPLGEAPPMPVSAEPTLMQQELARLRRQTEIIQAAAERLNGAAERSGGEAAHARH